MSLSESLASKTDDFDPHELRHQRRWCCVRGVTRADAATELRVWSALAWPVGISILARNAQPIVDLMFLGRLGTQELAAASVAQMWLVITSAWVWKAWGSAVNTLGAQALGAGNRALSHRWLEIALITITLLSIPVLAAWAFTEPVLKLANINPDVAVLAGEFARWYMLSLWPTYVFIVLSNALQNQGSIYPVLVANVVALGVNAGLNYLLVFGPGGQGGLGFKGSPIATSLTAWVSAIVLAVWMFWPGGGRYKWDWHDCKRETFNRHRIRAFLAQALPTGVGNFVEDFQLVLMSFLATQLGEADVATHNAFLQLFFCLTALLYGASKATQIRVGHALGAQNIPAAQLTSVLNLIFMAVVAVGVGVLMMSLRNQLGAIFSDDPNVASLAAIIAIPVGIGYCLISLFYSALAVLTGQGRVGIIAIAFLIGAWAVSVPLAFVFVDKLDWGLLGIWRALVIGYATITVIAIGAVLRSDWPATVRAAIERSRKRAAAEKEDADAAHDQESLLAGEKGSTSGGAATAVAVAVAGMRDGDVKAPLLGSATSEGRTHASLAAALLPTATVGYGAVGAAAAADDSFSDCESINR